MFAHKARTGRTIASISLIQAMMRVGEPGRKQNLKQGWWSPPKDSRWQMVRNRNQEIELKWAIQEGCQTLRTYLCA